MAERHVGHSETFGRREEGVTTIRIPELNHAQLDALAELMAPFGPEHDARLWQTWTESGGMHLYVLLPDDTEHHVAKNGNVVTMGVVAQEDTP